MELFSNHDDGFIQRPSMVRMDQCLGTQPYMYALHITTSDIVRRDLYDLRGPSILNLSTNFLLVLTTPAIYKLYQETYIENLRQLGHRNADVCRQIGFRLSPSIYDTESCET